MVPSLEVLCLKVAKNNDFWKVQRRQVEHLPEHAANEIFDALFKQGALTATSLELFQHCVTAAHLSGGAVRPDWLSYLGRFRFLEHLQLDACSKLKDDSLSRLLPLADSLTHLALDGCRGLQAKAAYHIKRLTSLTSLSLQGTSMGPPTAERLSSLSSLGQLDLAASTCLQSLDLTWTRVTAPPLMASLTSLTLASCTLGGSEAASLCLTPLHSCSHSAHQYQQQPKPHHMSHTQIASNLSQQSLNDWQQAGSQLHHTCSPSDVPASSQQQRSQQQHFDRSLQRVAANISSPDSGLGAHGLLSLNLTVQARLQWQRTLITAQGISALGSLWGLRELRIWGCAFLDFPARLRLVAQLPHLQSLHWDGVLQDVGKLRDSLPPPAQMVSSVSTPRSDGQTKVWPQEHRSASGTQALAKSSAQRQVDLTRYEERLRYTTRQLQSLRANAEAQMNHASNVKVLREHLRTDIQDGQPSMNNFVLH
ncbi:hypothetical protein WJX84_001655 [Apatococcus fuscideae]|uniref:Uncharacterized protein n=1 Tax=Apatococcus fuscideae TaxID=2026836 RepID=A0AAW1SUR6_9CHLO